MVQFVSVKAQTEATWTATRYFNSLPHELPVRAYEIVLAALATEADMSVRLRLDDVMATLIHVHGGC